MLEARFHVVVIVLWPRPCERDIVTSRSSDGSPPLPHFGQYGDGFPWQIPLTAPPEAGEEEARRWILRDVSSYDPIGLDGDDSIRDLS